MSFVLRSKITATAIHIPLAEYLETSYSPDREYIDGEVRERNGGIVGSVEQRVLSALSRVRIPYVVVLSAGSQPDLLTDPPLLVIEFLSPDDSDSDTRERTKDYRDVGVERVGIIDPRTRTGRMCTGAQWIEAKRLTVAGTPLYIDLDAIFSQIQA